MIGIYVVLGALGALVVALLIVLLGMLSAQKRSRMEDDARRQEQKTEQEAIKEKLIKLETLASNPAEMKTLDEINKRLESTTKLFGEINKGLGQLQNAAQTMQEAGKSISNFQELLKSPKLRGELGQAFMEDLIQDVLPPASYQFQYPFRDGKVVDAVIKTKDQLVPVDSKFPMDEFQRMVDEGIDEATLDKSLEKSILPRLKEVEKYIRSNEGTTDFALMYIPSEKIYSRVVGIGKILVELRRMRVFVVSPSTFYMYLQTIRFGLQGLEIAKDTRRILEVLNRIGKEFDTARKDWETVGSHISNASKKYDEVSRRLERIGDNIKVIEAKSEKSQKEIPYEAS